MKRERERNKIRRVRTENTGRREKKDMANVICVRTVGKAGNMCSVQRSVTSRLVNCMSKLK